MIAFRDITLGRYIACDSSIHLLDPRTKLVSSGLLMFVALSAQRMTPILLLITFSLAVTLISKLPLRSVLSNLRAFIWLLTFTIGLHAFLTPGIILFELPYVDAAPTKEGMNQGIFFGLRLSAVIVMSTLLTLTTSPTQLTAGLEKLFSPLRHLRIPVGELALIISIALRFIPVLADEAERLRKAQISRGADFSGGPIRKARNLLPLIVPLFTSAFDRADRLALAMESRGYQPGAPRSNYKPLKFQLQDLIGITVTILTCIVMFTLK